MPPVVNGVRLDVLSTDQITATVERFVASGANHVVHFLPAHPTVIARADDAYRRLLNRGDLNLADGASVAWALRIYGHDARRLTGTDGLALLCRWGTSRHIRHFFYGGTPRILASLRARLEDTHPGIRIVGEIAPPFGLIDDDELRRDAEQIRATHADFVWIGLGTPKQDLVADRLRELGCAPVILCVGAAFDFVAGSKRRAPYWLRRVGLEWAFRLAQEPRRLWRRYLLGNPRFVAGVVHDYVSAFNRARPSTAR